MDDTPRLFQSIRGRGLDHGSLPMRLWHKSKRLGIWDPTTIDLSQDRRDWQALAPLEQEVILHLTTLFQAGEESVALDLLPLIQVIAREGRLEEEMYLAAFLWEEAKHVEAFRRFLDEVAGATGDLSRFEGPSYREIFHRELPSALGRLSHDASPEAQAAASVTYNMIVEGVLAETGYYAYQKMLTRNRLMPGMQQIVAYLRADEARHIAYGVFLLSRLVAAGGAPLWQKIEQRMGQLVAPALGVVQETLGTYPELPFGLELDDFLEFAMTQFQRRLARIEKAQHQTLAELHGEMDEEAP